jgi:Ni/Co efflux regulator RcnB
MIGMRRLLTLMAAGLLAGAPRVAAQADAPNPFNLPRPEAGRDARQLRHPGRRLELRAERMERRGERIERRGIRMEMRGHPHRGRMCPQHRRHHHHHRRDWRDGRI